MEKEFADEPVITSAAAVYLGSRPLIEVKESTDGNTNRPERLRASKKNNMASRRGNRVLSPSAAEPRRYRSDFDHKNEPDWMRQFRHEALDIFLSKPMPTGVTLRN